MKKLILLLVLIASTFTAQGQTERGYRGFFEIGHNFEQSEYRMDFINLIFISTTHGYQLNPDIFIGGGIGLGYWQAFYGYDIEAAKIVMTTPYAMVRYDYRTMSRFSFFFANKIGATISSYRGSCLFDEPSIGTRYQINSAIGLSLSAGYQVGAYKDECYHYEEKSLNGFSLSLGIDF